MKGFIELKLQNVTRLIALDNIASLAAFKNSCRITLTYGIADLSGNRSHQPGVNLAIATIKQLDTDEGITYDAVKSLIEQALTGQPPQPDYGDAEIPIG